MQSNTTLASEAYHHILLWILTGELSPGEKLKGEYLKQKLNMGLSPIREALFRLTHTGLINNQDNIGFKVIDITESQIINIIETHAKIENILLKESILNGDDFWEAEIMSGLYQLEKIENSNTSTTYKEWLPKNDNFHNKLVASCKIEGLNQSRNYWLLLKEWLTRLAYKPIMNKIIMANHSEHERIAKLTIGRKIEQATNQLYTHNITSIDVITKSLRRQKLI